MTERERAEELYWHSDRGVNSIAEELGLSKSRFYELIEPLPIGVPCPECGQPLAYENRTARDRGEATCLARCAEPSADPRAPSEVRTTSAPAHPANSSTLLAGALIGAAACLLLFRMVRR